MESSRGDSDYCTNWYRNPDGPEAAKVIEGLLAINEELRCELSIAKGRERPVALSPMTVITGPEDLEPDDEGSIWDSSKNNPD